MGTRKVQKVGKSTYTVSLPHEWVEKNKVVPKTEVSIQTMSDGNLKISTMESTKTERKTREITLDSKEADAGYLIRKSLAAYIANYDIIRLDLTNLSLEATARDKIRRMIKYKMAGGEIIEESVNYITIQILLRPYEFPLDKLLMRMASMANDMLSDIAKGISRGDKNVLRDVLERDEDVDKLYFMGSRWLSSIIGDQSVLHDYGLKEAKDCLDYRLAFRHIERVADHVYRVSEKFLEVMDSLDASISNPLVEVLEGAGSVFIRSVNSLQNGSLQEANKSIHEARKIINTCEDLIKKVVNSNMQAKIVGNIIIILDSIKRIAEYGVGIAELAFNLHISG